MYTELNVDLDRLATTAATVAAEAAQADEAQGALDIAQALLLGKVIGIARPALRAIGTRPVIAYAMRHHADVNYNGGVREKERYHMRAVCLTDSEPWPTEDTPRANEGSYSGEDLFVREDGTLIALRYTGSWSRWQGSSWGWSADVTEYESALEAIRDGWTHVDNYIARLAEALEKAVGSREKSTAASIARAEKIGAVVSLLASGKGGAR